jgi:hypothetical protein
MIPFTIDSIYIARIWHRRALGVILAWNTLQ